MTPEQLSVPVGDDAVLRAERWKGAGPIVVLLHAGVADRRSWADTAGLLAPLTVIAYDRRGFGESSKTGDHFRHIDDLRRLLEVVSAGERAWLVGSSKGAEVALDLTVEAPDLVAGLLLLAPAISGAPDIDSVDPDTERLGDQLEAAATAGELDEVNRLETWLWLDGPTSPEGRVGGSARSLAMAMNDAVLRSETPEDAGRTQLDAWASLEEIRVPTTVACGDLDVPFIIERSRAISSRIAGAHYRELPGTAHLPYLENPQAIADLIKDTSFRAA